MSVTELSCQELVELVTNYLEGSLSPEEVERFERHLSTCPGCVTYVAQIRETVLLSGRLTQDSLDPKLRDALLAAFRNWRA